MNSSPPIRFLLVSITLLLGLHRAIAEDNRVVHEPEKIGIEFNASVSATAGVQLTALGNEYGEIRTSETALGLKYSRPWREVGEIGFGVYVQRTDFEMELGEWQLPTPDRLQDTHFEISYQAHLSEHLNGLFSVSPGWRTAGHTSLSGKGFGAVFLAMGIYAASPTVNYMAGAIFDTLADGHNRFVPVVGFSWQINPQWRLALGVPRTEVFYAFSEKLELGVVVEGTWSTYYVERNARFGTLGGRVLTDTKIEYSDARAGFQLNWHITPGIGLSATGGAIGYRKLEFPQRNLAVKTSSGFEGGYGAVSMTFQF